MKYRVDLNSEVPCYLQLYYQIRNDIINEAYKEGAKLPSKRLLSSETGTSVITIEHTYNLLCDEGYAQSLERRGYFVIFKKNDFVPVKEGPSSTKDSHIAADSSFSLNVEEVFPFSVFAKTMRTVISKYGQKLFIKSPNLGSPILQKTLCDYLLRAKGINVKPNQIVIGSGAEYLYGLIVQLLGWKDIIYGIENPSYKQIENVYKANGVKCDKLKMGTDGILSSELNRTNAKVLHVTPFRSYPTGISATAEKRNEYIQWARKRNGIIIEDDFDSEFTISKTNEKSLFSMEPEETVIYVNTFSHTIAPSMRIGYMILPTKFTDIFINKIGFYSCTVPVMDQYIISELIENGDFERHINRVRRIRRQKSQS